MTEERIRNAVDDGMADADCEVLLGLLDAERERLLEVSENLKGYANAATYWHEHYGEEATENNEFREAICALCGLEPTEDHDAVHEPRWFLDSLYSLVAEQRTRGETAEARCERYRAELHERAVALDTTLSLVDESGEAHCGGYHVCEDCPAADGDCEFSSLDLEDNDG